MIRNRKIKQLKFHFPELEREDRIGRLFIALALIYSGGMTAITVLALAQIIPIWIFPIPFCTTVIAVIIWNIKARNK